MRLLWTLSNWKRTGPVEPSLDLAAAMAARGHAVRVAVGRAPPGRVQGVAPEAVARGLPVVDTGARLGKHAAPLANWRDRRALGRWIAAAGVDAVVATLRNDHHLAVGAAGGRPVVRLGFGDGSERLPGRERRALAQSRGVLVFGRAAEARLRALGVPAPRLRRVGPPLAAAALRARVADPPALVRARLGVAPGVLLAGIVARLQRHRRFEVLWEALERLGPAPLHLLVIGRGTHAQEVAYAPVGARGLGSRVTFTGYLEGEAYASTLAALDVQLLLVPGSDPTCRALREGQALGVPSLVFDRGLLPELVPPAVGRVVREDAAALAEGLAGFLALGDARRTLGEAARRHAEDAYDPASGARALEALLEG